MTNIQPSNRPEQHIPQRFSIAALNHDRFMKYWRLYIFYNFVASCREATGGFVLFVVLQAFLGEAWQPLESESLSAIAAYTAIYVVAFVIVQYAIGRRALKHHLTPFLPRAYFRRHVNADDHLTSQMISREDRVSAFRRLGRTRAAMALLAAPFYAAWMLTVYVLEIEDHIVDNALYVPWSSATLVMVVMVVVSVFFTRLYFLRLCQLDFVPLLSLEWGSKSTGSVLSDEDHVHYQKAIANRKLLLGSHDGLLHSFTVWLTRRFLWQLTRLLAVIGLTRIFVPKRKEASDGMGAIGIREAYAMREALAALLVVAIFFFAVTSGSANFGLGVDVHPVPVSITMALLVLSLFLPSVLRMIAQISGRDISDPYERVTAEAFGLITQKVADDEYYSHEGKFDEKTGLVRYASLFRGTVDYIRRVVYSRAGISTADERMMEFSIILVDIDNFKVFNSLFGYLVADSVLYGTARILTEAAARNNGFAGRYGGEEFCVVLPDLGLDSAIKIAERICTEVQARVAIDRDMAGSISVADVMCSDPPRELCRVEPIDPREQDTEEVFPHLERARTLVDGLDGVLESSRASTLHVGLEHSKEGPIRRLVTPMAGKVWSTTVSVGVVSASDMVRILGDEISEGVALDADYVQIFRRLFSIANRRLDDAKEKGRNRVVPEAREESTHRRYARTA